MIRNNPPRGLVIDPRNPQQHRGQKDWKVNDTRPNSVSENNSGECSIDLRTANTSQSESVKDLELQLVTEKTAQDNQVKLACMHGEAFLSSENVLTVFLPDYEQPGSAAGNQFKRFVRNDSRSVDYIYEKDRKRHSACHNGISPQRNGRHTHIQLKSELNPHEVQSLIEDCEKRVTEPMYAIRPNPFKNLYII